MIWYELGVRTPVVTEAFVMEGCTKERRSEQTQIRLNAKGMRFCCVSR